MLAQLIIDQGYLEIIVYMKICSTYLKLKKMSKILDLDKILKIECNMQYFTRNCRIKNLDDFERDEADVHLGRAGLLNAKEKGMTMCYMMSRGLVMFLRRGKVN